MYPQAQRISTVFAYNRFGDGGSDKSELPQTGARIVATLRELLRSTDLDPPYVLVGHSIGGLYANLFARLHPQEVCGVVLVDSSHPDQAEVMQRATRGSFLGVLGRAFEQLYAAGNPTKYSEIAHFNQTVAQLQQAGPFPPVPLIVISAGKRSALASDEANRWISAHQRDLVTLSPRGTQVIAENSGHFVQNDQPDIVIQAIRQVLADSQQRTSTSGESGRTHAHGD